MVTKKKWVSDKSQITTIEETLQKIDLEKRGWKADPKLTMTITNNVTKKDILLLTGFMIVVFIIVVGLNLLR